MSEKKGIDERCREAAIGALERAFVFSEPQDNIAQAREIVAYLGATGFSDEEAPVKEALCGHGHIMTLLYLLLEQAERRVELDSLGGNTPPENLAVVGE